MISLPGFRDVTAVKPEGDATIFQAVREHDGTEVTLKCLEASYASPSAFARIRHEHRVVRRLETEGIVKAFELLETPSTPVIVYEAWKGRSLDDLLEAGVRFSLEDLLTLAIRLTNILGRIHAANVIHRNLTPSSILLDRDTGQVFVTGFGLASILSHEASGLANSDRVEGNLAYISPEQTGRMNRLVDYRTDFYTFGVVLYRLLCGRLPFESDDALELVYSHIAKIPPAPDAVAPSLNPTICRLVMKLLSKSADDRYQSAAGLQRDLEECLRRWTEFADIAGFELGKKDRPNRFRVPQKLYGREAQLKQLEEAFDRVGRSARELMLVRGIAGIGKTSLVRELYRRITERRGFFVSGKFAQLRRANPYGAVIEAFQDLISQLLSESDERLEVWRERLLEALGPNGQVIAEVIEGIEKIIGPQPPASDVGPVERENRFNTVFQDFIRVFCRPEHPLTIFLDDLQWADSASLNLVRVMLSDDRSHYLLVIGAYRENEVLDGHPLRIALEDMGKDGIPIHELQLGNLGLEQVQRLVCDATYVEPPEAAPMAELLLEKTDGNPFFIGMFLATLHTSELLEFDKEALVWRWDLEQVRAVGMTANVADLLLKKIQRCGLTTRDVMQVAACIDGQFGLEMLAELCGPGRAEVTTALQQAINEGLVAPVGEISKLVVTEGGVVEKGLNVSFRFTHDKIQKAAYIGSGSESLEAIHRRIGLHLLDSTPPARLSERIFDIVNQLNLGIELISSQRERDELSVLNLQAARKSKAASAFDVAYDYLKTGIRLLGDNSWLRDYALTLEVFVEAAEAAYLSGAYDEMDTYAGEVLRHAKTLLDKISVYEFEINALKAQHKLQEAVETALPVLKMLGVRLPDLPGQMNIMLGALETMAAMVGKSVSGLANLPRMRDPIKLASMRIITSVSSAAYFGRPELLPLPLLRAVKYSIQYGNAPESPPVFAAYGLVLCVMNKFATAYQFGELALELVKKLEAKQHEAKTITLVNGFVIHWQRHLRETFGPLKDAFRIGLETGDHEYAGFSAYFYCSHCFFAGIELADVGQEMSVYRAAMSRLQHSPSFQMYCIFQQLVANLRGQTDSPRRLVGEFFDEDAMQPMIERAGDHTTLCQLYIAKLILCYMFYDTSKAVRYADLAERYLEGIGAIFAAPAFRFYSSLARLRLYSRSSPAEQRALMRKVLANQKHLRLFARHAPMNHHHRYCLVEAERAFVLGQKTRAKERYDQAVGLAREHGFVQDESLANELAARLYLANDELGTAKSRMHEAQTCYRRWGAQAKADQLDRRYWTVIHPDRARASESAIDPGDPTLLSLLKALEAISEEIVLSRLLARMMKILIQVAGAQSGCLLMKAEGGLVIEAEKAPGDDEVEVLHGAPFETGERLAPSIVNWVINMNEDVVVENAAEDSRFAAAEDAYLRANRPQSVLCMRIVNKGELTGVLYLENNLMPGAFTEKATTLLSYLTAQIAISLENARLFDRLKRSETRFRQLYDNIADSVVLLDRNDQVLLANPSFYNTIGIDPKSTAPLTFRRWVHAEDLEHLEKDVLARLVDGKEVRNAAFRLVNESRRVYDVECNARIVHKEEGAGEFQLVIRDITERKRLQDRLFASLQDVQNARAGTILGLAKLAEYRDEDTGAHLERIREFSKIITTDLMIEGRYASDISPAFVDDIYFSSVLHDIGKVGIPDDILLKPGRLDPPEWEIMKRHSRIGGDVLRTVIARVGQQSFLQVGMQVAYHHHERWDGTGYPEGRQGREIPLAARIVALVDVYDAMTSKRVYKEPISHEATRNRLVNDRGTHFDPVVVDAFLRHEREFDQIRMEMHADEESPLLDPEV